jgi:hypothetical protein
VSTSPNHKLDIPKLEVPIIIDFDFDEPHAGKMQGFLDKLPILEATMDGLPSILDEKLSPECEKILSNMEPKATTKKRKTVSWAENKQKFAKI